MSFLLNIHKSFKNNFTNAKKSNILFNNVRKSKAISKLLLELDSNKPWDDIQYQLNYFVNSDIIIACPKTYRLAKQFISRKKIIVIDDISTLESQIIKNNFRYINSIGVISPFIVKDLINSKDILNKIQSVCISLILLSYTEDFKPLTLRQTLHKIAFYEIAIPLTGSNTQFDYSSVGVLPDGTHDFYSNYPGLQLNNTSVYVASKLALTNSLNSVLSWKNILGCLIDNNQFIRAGKDSFAISIYNNPNQSFTPHLDTISICATASWEKHGIAHSSLIGNYEGPGDCNMFAALLQLINDYTVNISLWKNDGNWLELSNSNINVEQKQNDLFSINYSLSISPSTIVVKVNDEILLEYEDTLVKRTGIVGIRAFNNVIALSNISINNE